jgi:hypothetical protein
MFKFKTSFVTEKHNEFSGNLECLYVKLALMMVVIIIN